MKETLEVPLGGCETTRTASLLRTELVIERRRFDFFRFDVNGLNLSTVAVKLIALLRAMLAGVLVSGHPGCLIGSDHRGCPQG